MENKEIEKAEAFLHAQGIYQSEVPLFRVKELLAQYADQAEKDAEIEKLKQTIAVMQEQDSQLSDVALSVEEIEIELGFKLSEFVQKYKWLLHAIESWKKEEEINIEHVNQLQSELTELKERQYKLLCHAFKAGRISIETTFEEWHETFVKQNF